MGKAFERWDDRPPVLPPRSILVRPEPIAVGTPEVESFSSYFARVADIHGLWPGKLAQLQVLPRLVHPTMDSLRQRFAGRSPSLGGLQRETAEWLAILKELTRRDDLGTTTVQQLAGVVAPTGLLRRGGVCAPCLSERRDVGCVYESLAWLLAPATVCPRHRVALLLACPWCGRDLVSLTWRSRPGRCARCTVFLGDQTSASPTEDEHAVWLANEVGRLISVLPELESARLAVPTAAAAVSAIVAAAGGRAVMRRELGISEIRFAQWTAGVSRPELTSLIEMARVAQVDLVAVLRGAGTAAGARPDGPPLPLTWRRAVRRRIDWPGVAAAFSAEARRPQPSPVLAMCRRLRVDPPQARRRIPAEYAALKAASAAARAGRSTKRRARLLAAVEEAVSITRRQGRAPSRRAVEARLPKGVTLREESLRDRWRELRAA